MVSYHCIIIIIVAFSSVLTGSVHVRNCDISDNISRLGPAQLATALVLAGGHSVVSVAGLSQCGQCLTCGHTVTTVTSHNTLTPYLAC